MGLKAWLGPLQSLRERHEGMGWWPIEHFRFTSRAFGWHAYAGARVAAVVGSKKIENHPHSVAPFAMYDNFVRIHRRCGQRPRWRPNYQAPLGNRWYCWSLGGRAPSWRGRCLTGGSNVGVPYQWPQTLARSRKRSACYCRRNEGPGCQANDARNCKGLCSSRRESRSAESK